MNRLIGKALVVAVAFAATIGAAGTSRADAIRRYEVVDIGLPAVRNVTSQLKIDDDGKLLGLLPQVGGEYILKQIYDRYDYGRNTENSLRRVGDWTNLLPKALQDPSSQVISKNILGHVLAPRVVNDVDGYFFAPESGQLISLRPVPGIPGRPFVDAMNDHDQIVGEQDGHGIFYASPTSDPIILDTLLDQASEWRLRIATGINNHGEIVGLGYNPRGEFTMLLLEPIATPEPSTLLMSAALCAAWALRGRSRRIARGSRAWRLRVGGVSGIGGRPRDVG